ncbi:glycoside hydrolase family 3 C-terminal domain-containing protein [bacterium]|nr:glycoside hydrolase family 3 C-terminal domain-containing protein [bacterium]
MTLEEKARMVTGAGMNFQDGQTEVDVREPAVGEHRGRVPGAAGATFAVPRLGIPAMVVADGPAGLRIQPIRGTDSTKTYFCTAFPIATALASTWDTDLVMHVGEAMGDEVREYGVDVILGPALNLHRIPLGGRNFEYYSEDPLIGGRMAAAMVRGTQSRGVGTSVKHFAANNHEWNRNVIDVIASERALRELYLRGFEIAIREGRPWTVMTSYNKINGLYTSESPDLLRKVLRKDWEYEGMVMTDWSGGADAVAQMKAGNELLMPGSERQQKSILEAVQNGMLDESVLDRNIARILGVVLESPAFKKIPFSNRPDLAAHAIVCRNAAADGMVLLKNDNGALPLSPGSKVAVFGNCAYEMITGGTGSGDVNEAYSVSLTEGLRNAGLEADTAIAAAYAQYIAEQKAARPPMRNRFMLPPPLAERPLEGGEIRRTMEAADMAVFVLGRNSGEFRDRELENDFYLSETEKVLISQIAESCYALGKKMTVVLNIGGVIETASWRDMPDAILLAWQPGQEAGNAIADVLTGIVNPSGKLADTFPMEFSDVPSAANFPGRVTLGPDPEETNAWRKGRDRAAEIMYEDDIWVGYRHYITKHVKTAYPFGYGLSYTSFTYGPVKADRKKLKDKVRVSVTVRNTGTASGREIVQVYAGAPGKTMPKPALELRAFAKTKRLEPGEAETLTFTITVRDLASFDAGKSAWITEKGDHEICIGRSSESIESRVTVKVPKTSVVEKVSRALSRKTEKKD